MSVPIRNITQGDVLLVQTPDGGDIESIGGNLTLTSGFETMAFLCLFGGNVDDPDGVSIHTFWANRLEGPESRHLVSRTQHLLARLPITTGNMERFKEAALADLAVFLTEGIATSVDVLVSLPSINTIQFDITIRADGVESSISFVANWRAAANAG